LGIGVSILSYAGQVRLGVVTDKGLVPDPESIIVGLHYEFEALVARSQVGVESTSSHEDPAQQDEGHSASPER
jgi:WS/DGAT C-terminal domain